MILNDIIVRIQNIAAQQPNINSVVESGNIYDLNNEEWEQRYSAFVLAQRTHSPGVDFNTFNFTLYYVDRLTLDESNKNEVQATAIEVLSNIVRYIKNEDWLLDSNFGDATTFTQKFTAMTAGAWMDCSIIVAADLCDNSFDTCGCDLSDYYTKREVNDQYVHKGQSGPDYEVIHNSKEFDGEVIFSYPGIQLPAPDEISLANGETLEEYIQSQSSNIKIDDDTIKLNEDEEIEAVNARLETSFDVQGVNIGSYSDGNTIPAGTKVWQVIKNILQKLLDVVAQVPTNAIKSTASTNTVYEVGTVLSPGLSSTYTDGKFVGQTGYDYSVNAGCAAGATTYQQRSNDGAWSDAQTTKTLTEGTNDYRCRTAYGASTVIPVKNNGEESDVRIAAGNTAWSSITFNARYKAYVANFDATSIEDVDEEKLKTSSNQIITFNITPKGTTTHATEHTSNGKSIIVAVPDGYQLKAIQNSLGVSILPNFTVTGTLEIGIGGTSTKVYNIYIYPITNNTPVTFKNITIS